MTHEEAVQFARDMRAAGASKVTLSGEHLSLELYPPEPPRQPAALELAERIGELTIEERQALLDQAKKDIDRDLFGAT